MLNAVMIVKDRYRLTKQALDSFIANSKLEWNVTIVDDCSTYHTERLLLYKQQQPNITVIRLQKPCGVIGCLKNLGVWWSETTFGRSDFLYIADNDGYFTPEWDSKLFFAFAAGEVHNLKLLGSYRHPYHLPNETIQTGGSILEVVSTDAVQGLGHLMRWETWDKYGPYAADAPGTNQSEDYAFCRRIVDDGFLVGSIQPDVVLNCGLTDTYGKPCVGAEAMPKIEGVIMQ
jgi:glycosyltransferase involved in cell wall biosynthesis